MKDTQFELENAQENTPHSATYIAAVEDMKAAEKRREQQAYGWMVMASAAAGGYPEDGKEPRVVVWARMVCLLFALAAPNLLVIKVLL